MTEETFTCETCNKDCGALYPAPGEHIEILICASCKLDLLEMAKPLITNHYTTGGGHRSVRSHNRRR